MTPGADGGGTLLARPWVRAAILLLLCLLAWSSAVHGGYVDLDTPWLVVDNPILSTGELGWVPTILWDPDRGIRLTLGAEYLPVRDLSVLLDFALFGPSWAWHHAHSLLWYLAACVLFLRVCEDLIGDPVIALLVAALFALHPVHVESVTWLASRKDVLGLFFFLLGVLVHLRARGRRWRPWVTTLCLLLAVWSKNTTIVLPVLLVAISLIHHRERPTTVGWWLQWAPLGLTTAGVLALSLHVGGLVSMYAPVRGGSLGAALLLETRVVFHYLGMIAWPRALAVIYQEPPVLPLLNPASLASLLGVLALLAAIPVTARRWPTAALGLAWFFLTLLPVSQLVPLQNLMADRYLLLPLGGAVLALSVPLAWLRDRFGSAPLMVVALIAVVLGCLTWNQNRVWHSSEAMWGAALERAPDHARVRRSLAGALGAAGRVEEAEALLREGVERQGEVPTLLAGLGLIALEQGRTGEAEDLLGRAWRADDDLRRAAANLLSLYVAQGRHAEAVTLGEQLTRVHPFYAKGWNNHGSALLGIGRIDEAERAFEEALRLDPFYPTPCCNLALVGLQRGQPVQVIPWAERCVELDPTDRRAQALLDAVRAATP
jgi:Flp pilus assembly protein TadD